ncbi:malto-oligosyltrehalose trehalohydrolase [Reyranella sp.]|uniref:malto-oligosyltrehalose trehalohydrolase n=1 Tax=Reyranella sp. TaxID=1929291 RepID=UPI003782F517
MTALSFGTTVLDAARTRFRLWAPALHEVDLEVDGQPALAMTACGDGWFETEAACGPGARYRYRLPNGLAVPDPASRAQADDVHGPSLVVDPNRYAWRSTGWRGRPWRDCVLYELHAGLFGGFDGVKAALPRLAALGITAVELMPVSDFSGTRNWGYDGVLPFAPDRAYGSPDQLKALIDAAHELQMMMFLDVVYNHFGPDGNYLTSYAPQFFRDDLRTPWGPAIDFRRPQVRRFFAENALHWVQEYRFDGLRLDAVHAISEPDWLDEMAAEVRSSVEPGRHVHLVLEHDGNEASHLRRDFTAQWNDDAHHALHVLLTGERDGYYRDYIDATRHLARCLKEGFAYQGDPSVHRDRQPRGTPSADLPPTKFVVFLQNHDQIGNRAFGDRLASLVDREALEAAVALQLLAPSIPLIFMGEETFEERPFLFFTDFHGELATAVREGRRDEFRHFAGFASAELSDPNARETFDRCRLPGVGDDGFYRTLLTLRHRMLAPKLDGARALDSQAIGPGAVFARWRLGDGSVLTIAANLATEACDFTGPGAAPLYESRAGALSQSTLQARSTVAFLTPPS